MEPTKLKTDNAKICGPESAQLLRRVVDSTAHLHSNIANSRQEQSWHHVFGHFGDVHFTIVQKIVDE